MAEENDKLNIIHRFDELYQEKVSLREQEQFCDEMLGNMRTALMEDKYSDAFYYASELKKYASGSDDYKDIIDACYLICAEHDVEDALIYFAGKFISKGSECVFPEAFQYLKKLSDRGYIPSFRWLADCYDKGIGCEPDKGKAERLYLEGMLFGDDFRCKERCERVYQGLKKKSPGTDPQDLLYYLMGFGGWDSQKSAMIWFAESILAGRVREYAPESGIVLLKHSLGYYGYSE